MKNLNLLFNKWYFDGIEKANFKDLLKDRNQEICGVLFSKNDYIELDSDISPADHRFLMKTSYPGLLVGTGYAHEAEAGSDDCIKLGFSFDYVSGQPYVPGSSVKGMLKSCFQPDVIKEVLSENQAQMKEDARLTEDKIACVVKNLEALKTDIFDGRDIFFDAVLHCGRRMSESEVGYPNKGNVIATDYITPHKGETKSPTPLMMVKVLPGVIFEFRFHLSDSVVKGVTVSAQQKIALFQTLIELFGIGAKTNVGYGVLTSIAKEAAEQQRDQAEADVQRALQARADSELVASRPAQSQRTVPPQPQFQLQRQQHNQPQQPQSEKHLCPACQKNYADNWNILCTPCFRKACRSIECAIPNCKNTTYPSKNGNGYQALCGQHYKEYIKLWPNRSATSSP